jgi:hypothetical protein
VAPALPPYALAVPSFRFRALAALAGRAVLGGPREVVLACFVGARLAAALVRGAEPALTDEVRAARASGARTWLGAIALPASTRVPLARLIDATGRPATAEAEATPPRRSRRAPAAGTSRAEATTNADSRAEVAAGVGAALLAAVTAAESWLDHPSRQELLLLCRDLGVETVPAPARESRAEPVSLGV